MKTFLLNKDNKPIIPWGSLEDEVYFIGEIPENYSLALSPGNSNIVIIDVDVKNNKNGYEHIPFNILHELKHSYWYITKSGGAHFFINYTGNKILMNTSTKYGLDLRIGSKPGNAGGYVRYQGTTDVKEIKPLIKESSAELNQFLESLFCGVNN